MINFSELTEFVKGRRVYIQTHNYPDADSIASAYGLQTLLAQLGVESTLIYVGKVEKFNTLQMIKLLNIELVAAEDADLRDEDAIILVDGQKFNSNIVDCTGEEIACIDHHKIVITPDYRFFDIREEAGACASIIASYFHDCGFDLPRPVATALLYGIKMDTADLARGVSELDIDMFYYLFKKSDLELISKIQLNVMEFGDLTSYAQAIDGVRVFDNIALARLDGYRPDALIASISDFMLALVEIEITVVYNIRDDGVKFSLRSELEECSAAFVVAEALAGLGSGGGHATMAGGFIATEDPGEDFDNEMRDRFLTAVARSIADFEERTK